MDGKLNAMRALDRAIDLGEMAEIDCCLDALSSLEGASIRAEEPAAFSARILHLEKENRPMEHSKKPCGSHFPPFFRRSNPFKV